MHAARGTLIETRIMESQLKEGYFIAVTVSWYISAYYNVRNNYNTTAISG